MSQINRKIQEAREAGYSSQEIVDYLQNSSRYGTKVSDALGEGFSADEIVNYYVSDVPANDSAPRQNPESEGSKTIVDHITNIGKGIGNRAVSLASAQVQSMMQPYVERTERDEVEATREAYGDEAAERAAEFQRRRIPEDGPINPNPFGYNPITTAEEFFEKPVSRFFPFAIEQGLVSIPDAILSVAALPNYAQLRAIELANEKAAREGRVADTGDVAATLPFAVASAALERVGARGFIGLDDAVNSFKDLPAAVLTAAFKEGGTEAGQEALDYIATITGAEPDFTWEELRERVVLGAAGGAGFGGAVRVATGLGEMTVKTQTERQKRQAEATLTEQDHDSPIADDVIAEGKAMLADGEGISKANTVLREAGMPDVDGRVSVSFADGTSKAGTVLDAFSGEGRPANAEPVFDEETDAQIGWRDPETLQSFPLDAELASKRGVRIGLDDGTIFDQSLDDMLASGVRVSPIEALPAPESTIETPLLPPPERTGATFTEGDGFLLRGEEQPQRALPPPPEPTTTELPVPQIQALPAPENTAETPLLQPPERSGATLTEGDGFVLRGDEQAQRALPAPPEPQPIVTEPPLRERTGATFTEGDGFLLRGEDAPQRLLTTDVPAGAVDGDGFRTYPTTESEPVTISRKNGEPFKTEKSALLAAKTNKDLKGRNFEAVPVEGGFVLREAPPQARVFKPEATPQTPAKIETSQDLDVAAERVETAPQVPADEGLFDTGARQQLDLVEQSKKPVKNEPARKEEPKQQVIENPPEIQREIEEVDQETEQSKKIEKQADAQPSESGAPKKEPKPPETIDTEEEGDADTPAFSKSDRQRNAREYADRVIAEDAGSFQIDHFYKDAFKEKRREVWNELRRRLNDLNLKDVDLRVADALNARVKSTNEAAAMDGVYFKNVVRVALDSDSPLQTVNHEAIHALRSLGLFSVTEWSILEAEAQRKWRAEHKIDERYAEETEERRIEEAVAEGFRYWVKGKGTTKTSIARIFDKVRDYIAAIGNGLRGLGFRSASDIFRDIDTGLLGARKRSAQSVAEPQFAIRVATNPLKGSAFKPNHGIVDALTDENLSLTERFGEAKSPLAVRETLDRWRTALQDKMLPLLRAQQEIEKMLGRPLAASENAYRGEELMSGRIGSRLEILTEDKVQPLFEEMHALGVSMEEMETYLYARHAPERNARVSEINPKFEPGEGSGMTDAEAAEIMADFRKTGRISKLKKLAERVDEVRDFALNTRVEAGLLSQKEANQWRKTYEHYVPLRGEAELDPEIESARPRKGSGINIKGKESQRALGRKSRAKDLLAYTILQAEEAIIRSETNEVGKRFLQLAEAAPDPDFWRVNKIGKKAVFSKATGQVYYRSEKNISAEDGDYTVSVKIDGVEHRVTMNRKNAAAVRLADTMRNLSGEQFGLFVRTFGSLNRFLSHVNTTLNPEFIITNAFRDLQTAAFNIQQFDTKGLTRGTLKDYPKALAGSLRGSFNRKADGEWVKWHNEFADAGGRVYFNQVEDIGRIRKRMRSDFQKAKPGISARKAISGLFDIIERTNIGVENAIRLAAYKNARQAGMSKEQAASLAKNLTVNFNRRGTYGPLMNSMYLFYNAGIQGTTVLLSAAKSRRVQYALGAAAMTGALLEMLNTLISGEDEDGELYYDKVSEFDKSRNLILMAPGGEGETIKIPLPYGYNVPFAAGRSMVEIVRGKPVTDVMSTLGVTFAESFNPIGGAQNLLNLIAPTVGDPIVDLSLNQDFAGRPIQPEQPQYGPSEPNNQRYWSSVSPISKSITDTLNKISGGDAVVPGAIDLSPEVLDHMAGVVLGAAGSFAGRNANLIVKLTDPAADVSWNDVPFARKVLGGKPGWYDKAAFYERAGEVEQAKKYVKDYVEQGERAKANKFRKENKALLSLSDSAAKTRKGLADIRKQRGRLKRAKEDNRLTNAEYAERLGRLREREKRLLVRFNKDYVERVLKRD